MFPYCCLLIIASMFSCSVFKVHLSCSLNQTVFSNDLSQRTSCRGGFYIRPDQVASFAAFPVIQPCLGAYSMRPYTLEIENFSTSTSSSKVFFAYFLFQKKVGGGPKWTRTTDLTIISRVL